MKSTSEFSTEMKNYLLEKGITESEEARKLRELTETHPHAVMMSSPAQTQLITLLLKLLNARRVIEVGVFTGYSTLRMAEAMEEDGRIYACDISNEWEKTGKSFWERAGVNQKIIPVIGNAQDTLNGLIKDGMENSFDLTYIDADKTGYKDYYSLAKTLTRPKGLILLDNTLQEGKVADAGQNNENVAAIRDVNTIISQDSGVEHVILPVSDGLTIVMKKP